VNIQAPAVVTMVAMLALSSFAASAQSTGFTLSEGYRFSETSGEGLFVNVCRGCHMADGKGATGAGTYPSLARNKSLQARGYAVSIVVHGLRDMPPFGSMMSDDQVAAVVNYLRTHFDNHYSDVVTSDDVKIVRR
jgi:mono/diheme cytochrome c family protein